MNKQECERVRNVNKFILIHAILKRKQKLKERTIHFTVLKRNLRIKIHTKKEFSLCLATLHAMNFDSKANSFVFMFKIHFK